MMSGFTREMYAEAVRYFGPGKYLYLNNAKVACTAIKAALWTHEVSAGRIAPARCEMEYHGPGFWEYDFHFDAADIFSFTFVRNPYSRILSCYLDKIAGIQDPSMIPPRTRFCVQHGIDPHSEIGFEEFLERIFTTEGASDDQHWRLQKDNILCDFVDIKFLGYFENIADDASVLKQNIGIDLPSKKTAHSTRASDRLNIYYTPRAKEIVQKKYAADFDIFGYSLDFEQRFPARPLRNITRSTEASRQYFVALATKNWEQRSRLLMSVVDRLKDPITMLETLHARRANKQESLSLLTDARDRWPDDPGLLHFAGQRARVLGNALEAHALLRKAVSAAPHVVVYLVDYARALIDLDCLDEAEGCIKQILLLNANHPNAQSLRELIDAKRADQGA